MYYTHKRTRCSSGVDLASLGGCNATRAFTRDSPPPPMHLHGWLRCSEHLSHLGTGTAWMGGGVGGAPLQRAYLYMLGGLGAPST